MSTGTYKFLVGRFGFDVNKKLNGLGWKPLHIAAFLGDKDLVEFFLKRGANVNAVSRKGTHHDKGKSSKKIMPLTEGKENITAHENIPPGSTALHIAAARGHFEVIDLLCFYGADHKIRVKNYEHFLFLGDSSDFRFNFSQFTPLHLAAFHGHTSCVSELLSYGAERRSRVV